MAIFVATTVADLMNADKRRHPAIYAEAPSSAQLGFPQIDVLYLRELQIAASSNAIRKEQLYSSLRDQLQSTARLKHGWDSYSAEPPSRLARDAAEMALQTLRRLNAEPAKILPSVDGGIGICFSNGGKYAQLEFLNDGEVHALLYGVADRPQAWQIDLSKADALETTWKQIGAFL